MIELPRKDVLEKKEKVITDSGDGDPPLGSYVFQPRQTRIAVTFRHVPMKVKRQRWAGTYVNPFVYDYDAV